MKTFFKKNSFLKMAFFFVLYHSFFTLCIAHEPIDVVYTWVDGADESWQQLKKNWQDKINSHAPKTQDALVKKRFRDNEELRYSLRSILLNAPFVSHIYIVTCGQKPVWLKEHPKITIVDHKDIFLNQEHLPTFNSMAIEANLHHISSLHERFLYFNDDVFLTSKTADNDFFTPEGKIKIFLSDHKLLVGPVCSDDNGYYAACKNTANLLNVIFGKKERLTHAHTPFASRVSLSTFVEEKFPEVFSVVSEQKFRSKKGFLITNGLIPYVAQEYGFAEDSLVDKVTWMFGKDLKKDKEMAKKILSKPPKFLCIQDSIESDQDAAASTQRLQSFLQEMFPDPAPWEIL